MSLKSFRRIFNLYSNLALLRKYRIHYGNDPRVYSSAHARDSSPESIELYMFRLIARSRLKYKTNNSQ